MLLDNDDVRIDGPAAEVYTLLTTALIGTLIGEGMARYQAEQVAMRALVRIEQRWAAHGFITRQVGTGELDDQVDEQGTADG
jgi:hypothetical protein